MERLESLRMELEVTRLNLADTREDLNRTEDELAKVKRKLEVTRTQRDQAWEKLARLTGEREAHWIEHNDDLGLSVECSACHIETCGKSPCCPNCGAHMVGPCYHCEYALMMWRTSGATLYRDNCVLHRDKACPDFDKEATDDR